MATQPSIKEVAEAAGVSAATVSGILNNSGRQSPATAAKVRAVMQELGYVPRRNRLRRNAQEAPERIGLLFPDSNIRCVQTPLSVGLAEGVQKVLSEQNVHLSILTLSPDGSLPPEIVNGDLDGVIVRSGERDEGLSRELEAVGIPAVWTFGGAVVPSADAVMVDDRSCGSWAVGKFLANGEGPVVIVKPDSAPNLGIEFRALTFEFTLQTNEFAGALTVLGIDSLESMLSALDTSNVTVFAPGHDKEVFRVQELLGMRAETRGAKDTLIAVMTADTPIVPHAGETVHVLHIDPVRIGMAAGRQVLWRRQNPWADPTRLLVPAKEISGPKREMLVCRQRKADSI